MIQFEKKIYVSHKYGGDKNNLKEVEEIIRIQQKRHPSYMFISPLHMFGFLYNDMSYEDGLKLCLHQLTECDEIWVTGDKWYDSTGVIKEIECANAHKIDILFVKNAEDNPHKVEGSADYIRGLTKGITLGKKEWQESTSKKNKVAYINKDDIVRRYVYHPANTCWGIPDIQIVAECPFCKHMNMNVLGNGNPSRKLCHSCHNLLDFSRLKYSDILRKRG